MVTHTYVRAYPATCLLVCLPQLEPKNVFYGNGPAFVGFFSSSQTVKGISDTIKYENRDVFLYTENFFETKILIFLLSAETSKFKSLFGKNRPFQIYFD